MMLRLLKNKLGFHPRAWVDALFTYPRFLGRIKPQLAKSGEDEIKARLEAFRHAWEFRTLKTPVGKRILVVAPHPDDETIGPGGLLLAHRGKSAIHIVSVFNGEGGGALASVPSNSPNFKKELVAARKRELQSVAEVLGATSSSLGLPDGYSQPTAADAERLGDLVKAFNPDVVLLPWYLDALPDHRMANLLYAASCADIRCIVLGFEVWSLLTPNCAFELGDLLSEKLHLVEKYTTQLATVDYKNYVKGLALTRAFTLGTGPKRNVPAEAFFALPNLEYCELVRAFYGTPGNLTESAIRIFGQTNSEKKVGNE
jgi:LmbE family N-acetylglucosaminyl deacetylase